MLTLQAIHNMLCRLFHTGSKQPLQTVERANYAVFAVSILRKIQYCALCYEDPKNDADDVAPQILGAI